MCSPFILNQTGLGLYTGNQPNLKYYLKKGIYLRIFILFY